jgi:hypothetical protein
VALITHFLRYFWRFFYVLYNILRKRWSCNFWSHFIGSWFLLTFTLGIVFIEIRKSNILTTKTNISNFAFVFSDFNGNVFYPIDDWYFRYIIYLRLRCDLFQISIKLILYFYGNILIFPSMFITLIQLFPIILKTIYF